MSMPCGKFNQIYLARPTPGMVPRPSKTRTQHQRLSNHIIRPAYNITHQDQSPSVQPWPYHSHCVHIIMYHITLNPHHAFNNILTHNQVKSIHTNIHFYNYHHPSHINTLQSSTIYSKFPHHHKYGNPLIGFRHPLPPPDQGTRYLLPVRAQSPVRIFFPDLILLVTGQPFSGYPPAALNLTSNMIIYT